MAIGIDIELDEVGANYAKFNVGFYVNYQGSYYTFFEVYQNGKLVTTDKGATFTLDANGEKKDLPKTITGLQAGTSYTLVASLWNAATGVRLNITEPTIPFRTNTIIVTQIFYAKVILDYNNNSGNTITYTGNSDWTEDNYAYVDVAYNGSNITYTGKTLQGFSTSRTATTASYDIAGTYRVRATSADWDDPTTVRLYAVWKDAKTRPSNWYWTSSNITAGKTLTLTAYEWNNFVSRIQEFANYLGVSLSSYYLGRAVATKGEPMYFYQANAVRTLIASLNPPTTPPTVSEKETVKASFIIGLKDSLNSIR